MFASSKGYGMAEVEFSDKTVFKDLHLSGIKCYNSLLLCPTANLDPYTKKYSSKGEDPETRPEEYARSTSVKHSAYAYSLYPFQDPNLEWALEVGKSPLIIKSHGLVIEVSLEGCFAKRQIASSSMSRWCRSSWMVDG
jgi:hypothetical protein